jgi:DNA-binding GntR family transcriptional regulator
MTTPTPKTATRKKEGGKALSAEQVCDRIRATILKGDLRPGDKLVEQDLALQYKVSRTPVREAIRQLEVERLVSRTRFVGVTVTQLRPSEIIELLDIREVLEGLVARLAARHAQPQDVRQLKATLKQMVTAAKAGDVVHYLDNALDFRRMLTECCRSDTLIHHVMGIENRLRLMGNRTAVIPGRMNAAIDEHEKLFKAIEKGDAALAEQLNRERIQHIRADVERSFAFSIF